MRRLINGLSLTEQISLGMFGGILVGIFLGDRCAVLEPAGTVFIKIMQITVLPLIVTTLISCTGSLRRSEAKSIARTFCLTLILFWALGSLCFLVMQFAFPHATRLSLFSTTADPDAQQLDVISLFVPFNPFHSLSEGHLPAVVIFCILLGLVLLGEESGRPLIDLCDILASALFRINQILSRTIPFGVFAVTAYTAGTITLQFLLELQTFIISLAVICILLCGIVLPLLVSSLTPFSLKEILGFSSKSVMLSFSSGNVFVSLPLIESDLKGLFSGRAEKGGIQELDEVFVPLAFAFPSIGTLSPILFLLFAAWYYQTSLDMEDHILLIAAGIPSLFGSSRVAVQFLLDLLKIPGDALQLYNASYQFIIFFASVLSSMSIFCLSTICKAQFCGILHLRKMRIIFTTLIVVVLICLTVASLNLGFAKMLSGLDRNAELIRGMSLPNHADPVDGMELMEMGHVESGGVLNVTVHSDPSEAALDESLASLSSLERISATDTLRVGYLYEGMPFIFLNSSGHLVGYDVQMAYDLARFLKVSNLEFVLLDEASIASSLNGRVCEVVMTCLPVTPERLREMRFTAPHLSLHLAFVVRDDLKDRFKDLNSVRGMDGITIAMGEGGRGSPWRRLPPLPQGEDIGDSRSRGVLRRRLRRCPAHNLGGRIDPDAPAPPFRCSRDRASGLLQGHVCLSSGQGR